MTDAAAVLARFVPAAEAQSLHVYGVHVLAGASVASHRWRSDDRVNVYSVSKGVSSLAAGMAIDEGLVALTSTVGETLPELAVGDGVADVTLRDLLSMTSGIDFEWFGDEPAPWPDLAGEMLRRPSTGRGTAFQYTDASTYVAMRMLGAVVGDVRDWLLPRLFEPLGIDNPQWHRCPRGWIVGGSDLYLRTEELARIGRVLRDRGEWQGERLVSASWIDRMHTDWVQSDVPGSRYGLAAWEGPEGTWRLAGKYGQFIIVDDRRDAVVTITAHLDQGNGRLSAIALDALSVLDG